MATRATYSFQATNAYQPMWIHTYIHYDGYPSGAAYNFKQTLELLEQGKDYRSKLRGNVAEQFLRANTLAEFTRSPDVHGDTEFHYEVSIGKNGPMLRAFEYDHEHNRLEFFNGTLVDFVARYSEYPEPLC